MRARARPISAFSLKMPVGPDAAAAMIVHRRSRRQHCARPRRRWPKHCVLANVTRRTRRASQQAAFISTRRIAALASAAVVQTALRRCRRTCRLPCRPQDRRQVRRFFRRARQRRGRQCYRQGCQRQCRRPFRQYPCARQQPMFRWRDAHSSVAPATLVKLRARPISARTRRTAAEPDAAAATASPRRSRQRRCA